MKLGSLLSLVILASLTLGHSSAQEAPAPVPTPPPAPAPTTIISSSDVSSAHAVRIAQRAASECEGQGFPVGVAVVDSSGNVKAFVRSDGAGPHTVEASKRKAFTSASTKRSTAILVANSDNSASRNLGDIDGFLLLAGGVPLEINGAVVGAVGVSGAPSGATDEDCAEAGINQSAGGAPLN